MSVALAYSTRTIKIYSGAYDATARADIDGHQADHANPHAVTAAQLGLALVDNTADADKPVSGPQAAALALKAAIASPALTGVPTAPTALLGTVTTQLATTEFAQAAINAHTTNLANPHAVTKAQLGLGSVDNTSDAAKPISTAQAAALEAKAPLASPALTGTPTAPTAVAGTATTQVATTAFSTAATTAANAAAAAAQADATEALADAAAAQADATQALADAAAAQSSVDVSTRPGDAVGLYGETKIGPAEATTPINPAWVVTSLAGSVVRVPGASADNPQTITPQTAYPVEPGRVYEVRWRVERQTNPADPLNDSVTLGVQWLSNTKGGLGVTVVDNIPLLVIDGVQQRVVRIGASPLASVLAPNGTVYCRPYIDLYGTSHVTDAITIDFQDITAVVDSLPVNVATPASGAVLTLSDLRPLFVGNASALAALTIKLPLMGRILEELETLSGLDVTTESGSPVTVPVQPGPGGLLELGFLSPVNSLSVQDSAGAPIVTAPSNAYGPGAALHFRYINETLGWVYWK